MPRKYTKRSEFWKVKKAPENKSNLLAEVKTDAKAEQPKRKGRKANPLTALLRQAVEESTRYRTLMEVWDGGRSEKSWVKVIAKLRRYERKPVKNA